MSTLELRFLIDDNVPRENIERVVEQLHTSRLLHGGFDGDDVLTVQLVNAIIMGGNHERLFRTEIGYK